MDSHDVARLVEKKSTAKPNNRMLSFLVKSTWNQPGIQKYWKPKTDTEVFWAVLKRKISHG
jgi:hypothetical protein